jgi:hypothetical protein
MIEYNEGFYLKLAFLFSGNWIPRLGSLLHATCVYAYIRVHLCAFVERSLCLWTRFILVLSLPSIACVSFSPSLTLADAVGLIRVHPWKKKEPRSGVDCKV